MKQHIKTILRDFYKNGGSGEAIRIYAPNADREFLSTTLKEFKEGVFNAETVDACADKILAYVPEIKEKKRPIIREE